MNIAHVVIQQVVTDFLGNQPIAKLIHHLFNKGEQVHKGFHPVKNVSYFIFENGVGTLRMHWNDVVPRVLQDMEKHDNLDTQFTVSIKGIEADIVVSYDKLSMWFNITSESFDKLFALASERAKE